MKFELKTMMGWANALLHNTARLVRSCWRVMETPFARWLHLSYEYGPALPIGSIRVLGLLPGKTGDPISCVLQTKTLHEADGTYEAISYCWGSESELTRISCNGRSILITPNLFDALHHFRDPKRIRYLWADAICINQRDQIEKGHQVKRMANVYEKAKQVMAWIGRDEDNLAEDCFALIRETVDYLDRAYISNGQKYFSPLEPASCQISTDQKRWDGVRELLTKDWFLRAWVVQEAGLGKACVLNWGSHGIQFVDVVELMYFIEWRSDLGLFTGYLGTTPIRILDSFNYIQSGFDNSQSWRTNRPVLSWRLGHYASELFMNIIFASRRLKASDRRDHVYAFLGSPMARRQDGELIVEPNYSKDKLPEDVFFEFSIALLANKKEAPWVLLYVDHTSEDDLQAVHLPSWSPRWGPSSYAVMSENTFWYRAGGDFDSFHSDFHEDTRHLRLNSCCFDHVQWTSEPMKGDNFGFNPARWTSRCSRNTHIDDLWAALVAIAGRSDEEFYDSFLLCLVRAYPFTQGPSSTNIDKLRADFRAYQNRFQSMNAVDAPRPHQDGNSWRIVSELLNLDNKRLIFTNSGRLGIAPSLSGPGDLCCVVLGLANPLILRPSSSSPGSYNLVGGAYINDVMNGELLWRLNTGDLKMETISLV